MSAPSVSPSPSLPADGRRLHLFGPMRATHGSVDTHVSGTDAQRVLAYLALHRATAHRRETLSDALFPDAPSRRRLTDALYRIRAQLGGGWIVADSDTVALAADVWADVNDFDRLVADGGVDADTAAVELYVDDLAPGLYDDWVIPHRSARRGDVLVALSRIADTREQEGNIAAAVVAARRSIVVEPLDEDSHQRYIRLLGRLRRYGEAIAHYEALRKLIAEELGVEPLATTTALVDQLTREREVAAAVDVESSMRFVGRSRERARAVAAVEAMLTGRGGAWCVEGAAGIGKTRLITEALTSARWRGATILTGDVRPTPEASPLDPIARAIEPAFANALRIELEAALGPVALSTLSALHPGWARPQPPSTGGGALGYAARVLGETIARLGSPSTRAA